MISDEVARQERIKEVEKERKESRDNFRRLEARIGKSDQITKDSAKAEEEFSKKFLDLELKNPLLDPSQQKALEKRRAAMDAKGLRGAFSGIKKSFDNFASPLKKFLGAGTGIPGFSVGKLGLIFVAIPLLIMFLRSEAFQSLIDLLKGPAGFVLDLFVSGVKLIFDQFTKIGEGIKKLSEGDLSGIGDILGGGGTLAVALAGILIILRPFKSLIALTGLVTSFVGAFSSGGKTLTTLTGKIKVPRRLTSAVDSFRNAMVNAGQRLRNMSRRLNRARGLPGLAMGGMSLMGGGSPMTGTGGSPRTGGPPGGGGAGGGSPTKSTTRTVTKNILKNTLKGGIKVAAGATGIGLPIVAAFSLFDGVMAGVNEYKESGDFKSALKQSAGGVVESLTFGLINKDTVAGALGGGDNGNPLPDSFKGYSDMGAEYRGMHSGGFLARGQLAMVGERGAELVMTNSPAQVFSEARTDQIGMNAVSKLMNGGGGMGGATVMVNTGGNTATNVTRNVSFRPSTHLDTNFDRYQKFA